MFERVLIMHRVVLVVGLLTLLSATGLMNACGTPDLGPAVAMLTVGADRASVPLGGPVVLTYRFTPSEEVARLAEPYRVSVDFLDSDGVVMFSDHHEPPVATTRWQPGETVSYERRTFVPLYPYVGNASIAVGLISSSTDAPVALAGEGIGQGRYVVASLDLAPPPISIPSFQEGWYRRERDGDREWWWNSGEAHIAFTNPRERSILYVEFQGRPRLVESPQRVDLIVEDRLIDSFLVEDPGVILHTVTMAADDFGSLNATRLTVRVSPTFVPAELPGVDSADERRLGIRVFRVFLEPV
jgi:hypothetical protein